MNAEEEIVRAVRKRDVGRVRELLEEDPHLAKTRTPEGTLVLTALYYGAKDALELLLNRVGELDVFEAAALGDADRLWALLDADPGSLNALNDDGYTPLGLAAFFGQRDAVEVLISKGADIDLVQGSRNANTALDAAVVANRREVVRALLKAGANMNVRSAGGLAPLHKAVLNGSAEIARMLLDHGAEVDARDDEGKTPLDLAVDNGDDALVSLLRGVVEEK